MSQTNPDSEIELKDIVSKMYGGYSFGVANSREELEALAVKKLLALKHQWQLEAIDQLTKNWNNYIGDMPNTKKDKLGYLELTGMLWGCAMQTKEELTTPTTKELKGE